MGKGILLCSSAASKMSKLNYRIASKNIEDIQQKNCMKILTFII
jgi:hypothetical protein